jgi:hypothetical protein
MPISITFVGRNIKPEELPDRVLEVLEQGKPEQFSISYIQKLLGDDHPIKFGESSGNLTGRVQGFTSRELSDALYSLVANGYARFDTWHDGTSDTVVFSAIE